MEDQTGEFTLKEVVENIRDYWHYFLSKWKIFAIGGVVGGLLGLMVSLIYPTKYTASVSILVDDASSAGGLMGLANSLGFGATMGEQSPFSILNIVQLFNSKSIIENALLQPIKEKGLNHRTYADLYIKEYHLDKNWDKEASLKDIKFEVGDNPNLFGREKDSVLSEIYSDIIENRLSVSQPDKKTSFIRVNIATRSEHFSKNFSEELVGSITKYYSDFKTKKASTTVNALQCQVDSIKRALYTAMGGAASSSDQVFGLNPAMSVQKITSAKEQAQIQMNIAILQELVKNLEVAKMDLLNNTPVIHIVDKPVYPLEKKEIKKLIGIVGGGFLGGLLAIAFLFGKQFIRDNF